MLHFGKDADWPHRTSQQSPGAPLESFLHVLLVQDLATHLLHGLLPHAPRHLQRRAAADPEVHAHLTERVFRVRREVLLNSYGELIRTL